MERILTALETISTIDANGCGDLPVEIRFRISKNDYNRLEKATEKYGLSLYDFLKILLVDKLEEAEEIVDYDINFGKTTED